MMDELSLNILDVAQNSITAGATLVEIAIEEDTVRDTLTILIRDNGCGMSEEAAMRAADPFYTTRKTRKVGLGLPFFKMAAEMTGGCFSIESSVGSGTSVRASFGRSHIDRAPLGDMAGTITSLVMHRPDIDFVYTHSLDGAGFALDTREVRRMMEGISIASPEVIAWMSEFISENQKEIYGGASK